jgi:hypothetical protein
MGHLIKLIGLFLFVIQRCTSWQRSEDTSGCVSSTANSVVVQKRALREKFPGSEHGFVVMSRFSPLEPIKDLTNELYVVRRTACCLRESFRQSRILDLPLLLGEGFVDGDSLV